MANFFVGQRVRIVWAGPQHAHDAIDAKQQVGAEARIVDEMIDEDGDWWVLDIGWGALKSSASDVLAPITPDGMQPVAWSECLWQPEGVAA